MSGFQTPISICDALNKIADGTYLLPSFQRDFKWADSPEDKKIEKLFDSLMQGYPIGSMLFWQVNEKLVKNNIKIYEFNQDAIENQDRVSHNPCEQRQKKHFSKPDFFAVLDGQQRLTAVRVGIFGTYYKHLKKGNGNSGSWDFNNQSFSEERLYLRLAENNSYADERKYIFEFKPNSEAIFFEDNYKWYLVYEITKFSKEKEKGLEVTDVYNAHMLTVDERKLINKLYSVYKAPTINYYLEETDDIDKAVKIFTRINNEGEPLTIPEIIYSILKSSWDDARKNIEGLKETIKNKEYKIDTAYIIKTLIYLFNPSVKNEIKIFDNNYCELVKNNWNKINKSIIATFDLLNELKLVDIDKSLSSMNVTLPIVYYIYHKDLYNMNFHKSVKYENDRNEIRKWLCQMLLRSIFSGQSDTVLLQARRYFEPDFAKNIYINTNKVFVASEINRYIDKVTSIEDDVLDELLDTQKDRANATLILSLLFPNKKYYSTIVHKDHLHPVKCYADLPSKIKENYSFEKYNSIVNLQLLTDVENEHKNGTSLKEWVEKEISTNGISKNNFYIEHLIPDEISLELDNFNQFYLKRKELLKSELKKVI